MQDWKWLLHATLATIIAATSTGIDCCFGFTFNERAHVAKDAFGGTVEIYSLQTHVYYAFYLDPFACSSLMACRVHRTPYGNSIG